MPAHLPSHTAAPVPAGGGPVGDQSGQVAGEGDGFSLPVTGAKVGHFISFSIAQLN